MPKAGGKSGWGKLMASFQSADDMLDEVNFCVSCLGPLGGPRVAAALRKVISDVAVVILLSALLLQLLLQRRHEHGAHMLCRLASFPHLQVQAAG